MKTYSQKPTEVKRQWYLVNASDITLGRLANEIAKLLVGKSKPTYTPHTDGGDYVVVINARDIKVTADKLKTKKYYTHSGYPGSIRSYKLEEMLEKDPEKVIRSAVHGMLPKNKLRDGRMNRLKVYGTETHSHEGQQPVRYNLTANKDK